MLIIRLCIECCGGVTAGCAIGPGGVGCGIGVPGGNIHCGPCAIPK